jgi:hypothetical protein
MTQLNHDDLAPAPTAAIESARRILGASPCVRADATAEAMPKPTVSDQGVALPSEDMTARRTSIRARGGNGRAIRSLETVVQDQRAAELRSASLTYAQIGERLGLSVTAAYESAMRGMVAVPTDDVVAAKQLELAKLDRRERYLFSIIESTHTTIEQGISACNALDRTQKRRAALLGLDEPARARIEVLTEDVVDAELKRLAVELGMEDRLPDVGLEL